MPFRHELKRLQSSLGNRLSILLNHADSTPIGRTLVLLMDERLSGLRESNPR